MENFHTHVCIFICLIWNIKKLLTVSENEIMSCEKLYILNIIVLLAIYVAC